MIYSNTISKLIYLSASGKYRYDYEIGDRLLLREDEDLIYLATVTLVKGKKVYIIFDHGKRKMLMNPHMIYHDGKSPVKKNNPVIIGLGIEHKYKDEIGDDELLEYMDPISPTYKGFLQRNRNEKAKRDRLKWRRENPDAESEASKQAEEPDLEQEKYKKQEASLKKLYVQLTNYSRHMSKGGNGSFILIDPEKSRAPADFKTISKKLISLGWKAQGKPTRDRKIKGKDDHGILVKDQTVVSQYFTKGESEIKLQDLLWEITKGEPKRKIYIHRVTSI